MKVAVLKETYPGERRVGLTPHNIPALRKMGLEVIVESEAGISAGFSDEEYSEQGAEVASREKAMEAEIVVLVRALGAHVHGGASSPEFREGQIVVAMCDPLGEPKSIADAATSKSTVFALELIPRITRAQAMDVLSSMATISGYRAVLLAAVELPKMFPLLMTAAGTVKAARVFVIGAGVAGLQAIATAKRLGAIVHAYDVRPAVREQVESLGGKFVELEIETGEAEDRGGYAKELGEEFYRRQRELMATVVAESDVVVTTAAIPGKPSPLLVTAAAVDGMRPGGVIVDLAAERGGNCELTKADERVEHKGIVILGPTNLPAEVPYHASQMYGNNVTNFLRNLVSDGAVDLDRDDEIIRETMVTRDGDVVHPRIRTLLGLDPEAQPTAPEATGGGAASEASSNDEDQGDSQNETGEPS